MYRQLRTALQTHINQDLSPKLGLAAVPAGGYTWTLPEDSEIDHFELPIEAAETGGVRHTKLKCYKTLTMRRLMQDLNPKLEFVVDTIATDT